MFYYGFDVVFQEVPGQISLCFSICGCPLRCKGCHSPFLFKEENGKPLTLEVYKSELSKYSSYATCVLFMGGEWHQKTLQKYLSIAKSYGYKTCLYTGLDTVNNKLLQNLDWIKTGKWIPELGGLENPKTNQVFTNVVTKEKMNYLFQKNS